MKPAGEVEYHDCGQSQRANKVVQRYEAHSPVTVEQRASQWANGDARRDREEYGDPRKRWRMKALEDEDYQRQLHHLAGRPGQQDAGRQAGKCRNPKQCRVRRAFDGHDSKDYGARTFSIVLKETFA